LAIFSWIINLLTGWKSCDRGSVAIQLGILMTVLLGMASLGTEIPYLMYKHRQMQTTADSAALGAAVAVSQGYPSPIRTEAYGIAAALGFTNGSSSATITVNNPPLSGNYTGNNRAVEVIASQPQTIKMAGLFGVSIYSLSARAVALAGATGSYCLLGTDTASATAVDISNGAAVTLSGCGLAVNATGPAALSVSGGSVLRAQAVTASGQVSIGSNGSVIHAPGGIMQNQPVTEAPYANVAMPASCGCDYTNLSLGKGTYQLSPGRYCGGITIPNGAVVSMAPGTYYIKSGSFSVLGGSVTGSGVTIVLTQNTSGYATVSVQGGSTVSLSAPTSGATAGLLFFGDHNAPSSNVNSFVFSGGTTEDFTGALYFPSQQILFSNGSGSAACIQLIAWHIQIKGTASQFSNDCSNSGVSPIGGRPLLVE
jgi:hypothetical protein